MNNSDLQKFAQIMAVLQEMFVPDKTISTMKVQVYFDILKKYDISQIATVADKLIRTKEYPTFPLPAEFINELGGREEENIKLRALKAWEDISSRGGYSADSHGADPLTDEAIRVAFGGWEMFGQTDPKNEAYDRKHFIDCFEMLAGQEHLYKRNEIETSILEQIDQTRREIKELEESSEVDETDP